MATFSPRNDTVNIDKNLFRNEVAQPLGETFESTRGFYLDRGTSLFDTLEGVSTNQASQQNPADDETVASHLFSHSGKVISGSN